MEWTLVAVLVIAILIFVISRELRRPPLVDDLPSQEVLNSDRRRSPTATSQVPARLSATDVLARLQILRNGNAQWDEILSELNPTGDNEVQRLLIEIRGPHMFVPHVGLGVIEDGCKKALVSSPKADALAVLREATCSQNPFVRY